MTPTVHLATGAGVDRSLYHTDGECRHLRRANGQRTVDRDLVPDRRECKVCAGEASALGGQAERSSCRHCDAELDADGVCPFCAACDDVGVTNGRHKAARRARREADG